MTTIIGIKITDRLKTSTKFQNIISKYGCGIKTRIGLHSNCSNICKNWGIILLEIVDDSIIINLQKELLSLDNIKLQSMVF